MTDILERIEAERTARAADPMRPANPLLREAAAEIERLLSACKDKTELLVAAYSQIDRLRAALDKICGITLGSDSCDGGGKIHKIAVVALNIQQRPEP